MKVAEPQPTELKKAKKPEEMGPHEHGQPTTEKSFYEGGMKVSTNDDHVNELSKSSSK
jgi:hypothetical protein